IVEYEELDNGTEYVVRDYEEYEEYEEYEDRYGPATRNGNDHWNGQVLNFSQFLYFISQSDHLKLND
ncbi:collagen, type V, alpha 3b, partial [Tachysurus ichikawai]